MGYKGDSCMDCGYFFGGFAGGLVYVPPEGSENKEPVLIPWSAILDDSDEEKPDGWMEEGF